MKINRTVQPVERLCGFLDKMQQKKTTDDFKYGRQVQKNATMHGKNG
jgi:hypothetical protein